MRQLVASVERPISELSDRELNGRLLIDIHRIGRRVTAVRLRVRVGGTGCEARPPLALNDEMAVKD